MGSVEIWCTGLVGGELVVGGDGCGCGAHVAKVILHQLCFNSIYFFMCFGAEQSLEHKILRVL